MLSNILDDLAPKRVIKVKTSQIVSQKVEKLKKKRDRMSRVFKKTKNTDYFKSVNDFNKDIRKALKEESSRIFQDKAKSRDPKTFWQAINQSLGKCQSHVFQLENENKEAISDSKDLAHCFANFFRDKVQKLSSDKVNYIITTPPTIPTIPLKFSLLEIQQVF
jgi:hypothetical protein